MAYASAARGFAAGLVATGLLWGCGPRDAAKPAAPPQVGVVQVKAEAVTLSSELPGRITAAETSEVRPQVSGVIERRFFDEGSIVEKGQLLYQIQDAPYRAALAVAEGNLATAQAAIRSTQLQAERYQRLLQIKGVSQQDADNADAAALQARATAQARRAEVQAAKVNLDFTRVRAPISGRIGRSMSTVGALAQAGQAAPLATIQQIGRVYVDVTQSASEVLNLREAIRRGGVTREGPAAAPVELVLPNGKVYPAQGRLEFSEIAVDPSSGSVTLRATFANPDGVLLPGMYVRARLVEGVRSQAVLAPQQGVTHNPRGQATALVVGADEKVVQRVLTTDRAVGDKWIVTDGLNPGDRLIVEGQLSIKPGMVVAARPPAQVTALETASSARGS
jgi:membrane fusion protein (multidrug efflux system)